MQMRAVPRSKRILDLSLALPAVVLLSPVMVVIGLMILVSDGRPILFRHVRPGLGSHPFVLLKFRTMTNVGAGAGPEADAERLTRLGRAVRSMSLDELPSLFNVLRGDMSLVGPRPLLPQYLDRYTPEQARRHDVLPGLTGWAQIHGRNAVTWEEKLALDVWYVDHRSLRLDVKILVLTVWKVLKREGISQPGHATAEEFKPSPEPPEGP